MSQSPYEAIVTQLGVIEADAKHTLSTMDELSEWDSVSEALANFQRIGELTQKSVAGVEYIVTQGKTGVSEFLSSAEKKAAAVAWLKSKVKLPTLLAPFAGTIWGYVVDFVVREFNARFGKSWGITSVADIDAKVKQLQRKTA